VRNTISYRIRICYADITLNMIRTPPTLYTLITTIDSIPSQEHEPGPISLQDWNTSLGHALTDFEIKICPWKNPIEWLDLNTSHVNLILRRIVASTNTAEIEDAVFEHMIYQVWWIV
jgi:hypothetical protein